MLAQIDLDQIQSRGLPAFEGGSSSTVGGIISKTLPYVFYLSGILLLVYLIAGGFQLMLSRGDPKAVEGAKGKITNALVGFIIVIFAFFLVNILGRVFNLEGTFFGQIFN